MSARAFQACAACAGIFALRQDQQVSDVTDAEHQSHDAPMERTSGAQKVFGLADQHHAQRQQQKNVDWNENNKHAVPSGGDPTVLQWNREISPEKHAPVSAAGRDDGQKLF